jgi:hypothetical protein
MNDENKQPTTYTGQQTNSNYLLRNAAKIGIPLILCAAGATYFNNMIPQLQADPASFPGNLELAIKGLQDGRNFLGGAAGLYAIMEIKEAYHLIRHGTSFFNV